VAGQEKSFIGLSYVLVFSTGLLLSAAFPPLDLGPLAFVALVPLFYALKHSTPSRSFFLGYVPGVILAGTYFHPLTEIEGFPLPGYLAMVLVSGVFYGLFALFYFLVTRKTGWSPVVVAPALWVAVEFLRAHFFFLPNPLLLLGYTQHDFIHLIQIAAFTSVYGVSFVVVLVNALIADLLLFATEKRASNCRFSIKHPAIIRSCFVLCILILIFSFGFFELNGSQKEDADRQIRAALVQPNLTRADRNLPEFKDELMDRYTRMTLEASLGNPELIIWPENSTLKQLTSDPETYFFVISLVREIEIPLLLGSCARDKTTSPETPEIKVYNSVFLVDRKGKIASSYGKIRLTPFWEYLPLKGSFAWPKWLVPEHGHTTPGRETILFSTDGCTFGVVICWESLFPDFFRRFTRQGPDFMVNPFNDSAYGWTTAPYKLHAMTPFRAVENRMSLLRCGLTGLTSHIDPYGRETARIIDEDGKDLMVRGFLVVDVPVLGRTTFYTRYGDVFAYLCVVWTVLMLICFLVKNWMRRSKELESQRRNF